MSLMDCNSNLKVTSNYLLYVVGRFFFFNLFSLWLVLNIFSNISISFLVFLCFNRPVVWWFSYLGLGLGFLFPNVYCIILVLSGWSFLFRRGETGNALVNSAVLGSKCFFKHHLLFSLHERRKFTPHAWEEKRYNLISYLSPFFTLRPDECLPGGQWLSSPLQRLSHQFVVAGRAAAVITRCLLLEGGSIFTPGTVQCAIPFSPVPWEPFQWRE